MVMVTGKYFIIYIIYSGYQVGRPVIGGFMDTSENNTGFIERTSINIWKPGNTHFPSKKKILPLLH